MAAVTAVMPAACSDLIVSRNSGSAISDSGSTSSCFGFGLAGGFGGSFLRGTAGMATPLAEDADVADEEEKEEEDDEEEEEEEDDEEEEDADAEVEAADD